MLGLISLLAILVFPLATFAAAPNCNDLLNFLNPPGRPSMGVTPKSTTHIFEGDFTTDPLPRIKGGLHSFAALENFLAKRPDIFELGQKLVEVSRAEPIPPWYFLLEDAQSGVGYVRLPESAYTAKALAGLWASDDGAQGGYLWKTLFPRDLTEQQLWKILFTLHRTRSRVIDRGWAEIAEGTFEINGRSLTVRMVTDKSTGSLISAYPAFTQHAVSPYKSFLPLGRAAIISGKTVLPKDADDTDLKYVVDGLLDIPIHEPSIFGIKNFSRWNALPRFYIDNTLNFLKINSPFIQGNVSGIEKMASSMKAYPRGAILEKIEEIIQALRQDSRYSSDEKLKFFSQLVLNHQVSQQDILRDILWGRYLIGNLLEFSSSLELEQQKLAIAAIEASPIYWLLLLPLGKSSLEEQDYHLSTAKIAAVLNLPLKIVGIGPDDKSIAAFFALAKKYAAVEWVYFDRLDKIEKQEPGYFSRSNLRRKTLTEVFNIYAQMSGIAAIIERKPYRDLLVYGAKISTADALKDFNWAKTKKIIEAHQDLYIKYLGFSAEKWAAWIEWSESVMGFDRQSFEQGLNTFGINPSPEFLKAFFNNYNLSEMRSGEWRFHFPRLIHSFSKDGELREVNFNLFAYSFILKQK